MSVAQAAAPGQPVAQTAVFSTELGRRPPRRLVPPFPPVIVRGDRAVGIRQYAHYWRGKHPHVYYQIFPQTTIEDLWDDYDIHLDSPAFLRDVIMFISHENINRARMFAMEWSNIHKDDRLHIAGGDLGYDPCNPLACLDKLFTQAEIIAYGPGFLWHVLNMTRKGLATISAQQDQAKAKPEGSAQNQAQQQVAASNAAVRIQPSQALAKQSRVPFRHPQIHVRKPEDQAEQSDIQLPQAEVPAQQPHVQKVDISSKSTESSGKEPSGPIPTAQPSTTSAEPSTVSVFTNESPQITIPKREETPAMESLTVPVGLTNVGERRTVSDEIVSADKLLMAGMDRRQTRTASATPTFKTIPEFGQVALPAILSGPDMRSMRGGSSSYHSTPRLPPQRPVSGMYNDMNRPGMPPHAPTNRPPSGPMQFGQSPQQLLPSQLATHMNMPPQNMYAPLGPGQPMNPFMNAASGGYFSPPQSMVLPQTIPLYGVGDMSNFQPPFPPSMPGQPHDYDRQAQLNDTGRQQILYDPHGGARRGYSDIKSRNRGRGGFFRDSIRGGAGGHMGVDPASHVGSSHRQENMIPNAPAMGNQIPPSNAGNGSESFPNLVNTGAGYHGGTGQDEAGCGDNWIGPMNNTVKSLYFGNLPEQLDEPHFIKFIQDKAKVRVMSVSFRRFTRPAATVIFPTTAEAREALDLHRATYVGRRINVAVSRKHLLDRGPTVPYNSYDSGSVRGYPAGPRDWTSMSNGRRVSSGHQIMNPQSSAGQDMVPTTGGAGRPTYSPQDARSDLQRPMEGAAPGASGSPEARKTKRQGKPPKKLKNDQAITAPGSSEATPALNAPAVGASASAHTAEARGEIIAGNGQKPRASGAGKGSKKTRNNQKVTLAESSKPVTAPNVAASTLVPVDVSNAKEKNVDVQKKDATAHEKDVAGTQGKTAADKQKKIAASADGEVKKTKHGQKMTMAESSELTTRGGAAALSLSIPANVIDSNAAKTAANNEKNLLASAIGGSSKPALTTQKIRTTPFGSPSPSTGLISSASATSTKTEIHDNSSKETSTAAAENTSIKQETSAKVAKESTKSDVAARAVDKPVPTAPSSEAGVLSTKVPSTKPTASEDTKASTKTVPATSIPSEKKPSHDTSAKDEMGKTRVPQTGRDRKKIGSDPQHPDHRLHQSASSKQTVPAKEKKPIIPSFEKSSTDDQPPKEMPKQLPPPKGGLGGPAPPKATTDASSAQKKQAKVDPEDAKEKAATIQTPASQNDKAEITSVSDVPLKEPKDTLASPMVKPLTGPRPSSDFGHAPKPVPASPARDTVDDGALSDDEQKHDTSFHSAKETQSEGEREARAEGEKPVVASTSIAALPQEKPVDKKPGAKQTESLHPVAKEKQLKAQRKKEKEAKRKEARRLAQLKRSSKNAGSSARSNTNEAQDQPVLEHVRQNEASNDNANTASEAITEDIGGAGQQSARDAEPVEDTIDSTTAEQEKAASDGGKAITADPDTARSKHGSSEQVKELPPDQSAPSCEPASPTVDPTQVPRPASVPPQEPSDAVKPNEDQEREKKAMAKRAKAAIPDIILKGSEMSHKSSGKNESSGGESAGVRTQDAEHASGAQAKGKGKAKMIDDKDEAAKDAPAQGSTGNSQSEASDDTLVDRYGPLVSPSPTTEAFFTPAQTPGLPPPTPGLPAPSKKKRKTKKKKSKTGSSMGSNTTSGPISNATQSGAGGGQNSGGTTEKAPETHEAPDVGQNDGATAETGAGQKHTPGDAAETGFAEKHEFPDAGPSGGSAAETGVGETSKAPDAENDGAFAEQMAQLDNLKSEGKSVSVYDKEAEKVKIREAFLGQYGFPDDGDPDIQQGIADWMAIKPNKFLDMTKEQTEAESLTGSLAQQIARQFGKDMSASSAMRSFDGGFKNLSGQEIGRMIRENADRRAAESSKSSPKKQDK